MQGNAKIRDALKTEYTDFVDFCISLDKQFISELITSDFIAFRTQRNATRDYIERIRQMLDNYTSDMEVQQENDHEDLPEERPFAFDETEESVIVPEEPALGKNEVVVEKGHSKESSAAAFVMGNQPRPGRKRKNLFSSGKAWQHGNLEEFRTMDEGLPLYDLFDIPRNPIYASRDVVELELSTRPYRSLMNNHCKTFDALFTKTLQEISNFTNVGKKSLSEIVRKCREFTANPQMGPKGEAIAAEEQSIPAVEATEMLLIAESIALGIEYSVSDLNEAEKGLVYSLIEAYQVLGEDLCLMALEKPDKARELCLMLDDYIERQRVFQQGRLVIDHLSSRGISIDLHALPFVAAVKKKTAIDLKKVFTEDDRLADISTAMERYLEREPQDQEVLMESIQMFADAVATGISTHLARAYARAITNDRVSIVVKLRQEGHSLKEAGDLLDITRERVRQIEGKAIRIFSETLRRADKDVIAYIRALLDGELMLHKDDVAAYVTDSDQLNLFWACVKNGAFDGNTYSYQKKYRAVVFNHESVGKVEKIVDSLPQYIFKDELEEIIRHAIVEEGVLEKKIRADIKQRYKVFGKLYSEHRPTLVFICDWVLKNRFSNGFKVNDETDAKRFLGYICEVFGEERSHMTQHALDAKVSALGVLCDRGKYIHPSEVTIHQSILDEVDRYIADSPKNAISFMELFEAFKNQLAGTQISNRYFLQGVMKLHGSYAVKNYHFHRDYITKEEGISPADELDAFVRERGIVHKSEITAEFPALDEISVGRVAARCSNVLNIYGGNYIHASQFHIHEEDYDPLRSYLTEATRELPLNIRKAFNDCAVLFPMFMDRNELYNRDMLFAVLNYMFGSEFRFTKPYIANTDNADVTNRGVTLSILEPYDEIEIDELMDILDEHGIHYVSFSVLMQMLSPDYIRTDKNTLMKRVLTGMDDDVVEEALNTLSEAIETEGYLPSCKVLDFIWYPSIDVAWTPYLLEGIVLSSNKIDYVPYTISRSNRTQVVYVSKKYAHCDFQSLVLNVIAEGYNKGIFTQKSDMREWLIDAGFIDEKLPNFLESAQFYYMGDDGRLIKREEAEQ